MKPLPITLAMTAFDLFAGAIAVWLAATIDPPMLTGSACGTTHCWRCLALAADLAILIAAAVRQIAPKPARL
ncbi:MAG TPA: hypothetical protein VH722_09980 [Alphaproteobacteria bacterium]|jgi:hypothetical protein|nr:hypothetical protein [Alphaproteobacteria bacterium]